MPNFNSLGQKLVVHGADLIENHTGIQPTGYRRADFLFNNLVDRPLQIAGHIAVFIGAVIVHAANR